MTPTHVSWNDAAAMGPREAAAHAVELRDTVCHLYAELDALRTATPAPRPRLLKVYIVEGNVIAARSSCDAAVIADEECGDAGPVVGPLKPGRTVPIGKPDGSVAQITVAKLLAAGVQRGVVTRADCTDRVPE